MTNSNSSLMMFSLSSSNEQPSVSAEFLNCTLGSWTLRNINNVTIEFCSVSNILSKLNQTALSLSNSTAWISDIIVQNVTFIKLYSVLNISYESWVSLKKAQFRNNTAFNGLIHVADSSALFVYDSQFYNNNARNLGGVIYATKSFVTINFTRFKDNTAYLGGAIYIRESASVNIRYSNFTQNRARAGGAIVGIHTVQFNISNSQFILNKAVVNKSKRSQSSRMNLKLKGFKFLKSPLAILFERQKQSGWLTNKDAPIGGVLACVHNCLVNIKNCTFERNTADMSGSCIDITQNGLVHISESKFTNNTAGFRGCGTVCIFKHVNISVLNTTFHGNSVEGTGVAIGDNIAFR